VTKRGHTLLTPKRRAVFLEMIGAGLTIERAAKAIGVTRMTCYQWRRTDAQFRAEWESAIDDSIEKVETGLIEAAAGGDVTAAIFLLRSRKPDIYNPNLVLRRAMLQLALEKARAEASSVLTIEGHVGHAMIYPTQARLEVPRLLGKDDVPAEKSESTHADEHTTNLLDTDNTNQEDAAA
jgi:hypothetical protein